MDKTLPIPTFKFSGYHSISRNDDKEKVVGKYRITGIVLGQGTYGIVKLCQDIETGKHYSCKVYNAMSLYRKREFNGCGGGRMRMITALDKAYKEIELMQQLTSVSILQLHDVLVVDYGNQTESVPDNFIGNLASTKIYLITDFMSIGSLMNESKLKQNDKSDSVDYPEYVSLLWNDQLSLYDWGDTVPVSVSAYPEALVKCFIKDALKALEYLHSVNIAHRDVKPDNLLLHEDGHVKLGDFSVAGILDENGKIKGTEGTYIFLPPECTTEDKLEVEYSGHFGRPADIWSLGVSVFCLLFGKVPFYSPHGLEKLFDLISKAELKFPTDISGTLSSECKNFIESILVKEPSNRPTATQLLEHPWLNDVDYTIALKFAKSVLEHRKKEQ